MEARWRGRKASGRRKESKKDSTKVSSDLCSYQCLLLQYLSVIQRYVLVRKIGNRFFRNISDTNITPVELIYQKICSEGYTSEQELFQDIFDLYGNISIFSFNKGNDSTLPK